MEEKEALLILNNIASLGPKRKIALLQHFGSAVDILKAKTYPEVSEKSAYALRNWPSETLYCKDLDLVERFGIEIVPYGSSHYPRKLMTISDAPILLYVSGDISVLSKSFIAIIGTRKPSSYGEKMAYSFAKDLTLKDLVIASGLALGVDTAAHKGALSVGKTVAVIGSGLANIYPPENASLAQNISKKGAVISEFPMYTLPERRNFPLRNRIVSGISLGTLLIEAPKQSGAMLTMQQTKKQKRKLFAITGKIDEENFRGNHSLIKNGDARLVENCDDILLSLSSLFENVRYLTKN